MTPIDRAGRTPTIGQIEVVMNIERILEASEAVGWLSEQAATTTDESRLQMGLALVMAHSYLTEYAAHLSRGIEPYDALEATARGELELSPRQRDLMKALMPPEQGQS